jgi:catechol 2,3-dioxygenase
MTGLPQISFSHVGVYVFDIEKMVDFYERMLGLVVTDRGDLRGGQIVFLSRDTTDHHQIAFVTGREAKQTTVNQLAFRLDSLGDLRDMSERAEADPEAGEQRIVCHGNAWSTYFEDPEGNRIEFFVDSPFYVEQPAGTPFDLSQSDEEIMAWTAREFGGEPTFKPVEQWRSEFAERLN